MDAAHYAHALERASRGKSDADVLLLGERFATYLEKRGHLKLLPRIVRAYEKLDRRKDASTATVRIAREGDRETFRSRIDDELRELGVSNAQAVRVLVDPTLTGGYAVRSGGLRVDQTHKRRLLELFTTLTNRT